MVHTTFYKLEAALQGVCVSIITPKQEGLWTNGGILHVPLLQVIKQEGLRNTASECTLFDLLKYNDMDDDERLTKDEFYSAFGEGRLSFYFYI